MPPVRLVDPFLWFLRFTLARPEGLSLRIRSLSFGIVIVVVIVFAVVAGVVVFVIVVNQQHSHTPT